MQTPYFRLKTLFPSNFECCVKYGQSMQQFLIHQISDWFQIEINIEVKCYCFLNWGTEKLKRFPSLTQQFGVSFIFALTDSGSWRWALPPLNSVCFYCSVTRGLKTTTTQCLLSQLTRTEIYLDSPNLHSYMHSWVERQLQLNCLCHSTYAREGNRVMKQSV